MAWHHGPVARIAWSKRRITLVALLAGWALVLGVIAYVSARNGTATAREQTTVADARPAVDRGVADVVRAGSSLGAVVAPSPFTRIGSCRISAVRDGERWEQSVTLFTRPGDETALLDRLGKALPPSYRASVRARAGQPTLRADAGNYVGISAAAATPGEVRVTVATGCRGVSGWVMPGEPPEQLRAPLAAPIAALKLAPARWRGFGVPCPDGREVQVVTAEGEPGVVPVPLPGALSTVGPSPVVAEPDRYAYRSGITSVVARIGDSGLSLTATTPCL